MQNGATPFLIACQEGHYDIVLKLIRHPTIKLHDTAVRPYCLCTVNVKLSICMLILYAFDISICVFLILFNFA